MALTWTDYSGIPSTTLGTLFTDATPGIKTISVDQSNIPAGSVIMLSVQVNNNNSTYIETENIVLSNVLAPPGAPDVGYETMFQSQEYAVQYGIQVQWQLLSGTAPASAIPVYESSVS